MVEIIISDFDGTLVGGRPELFKGVDPEIAAQIRQFQSSGRKFIIATGRHPSFIKKIVKKQFTPDAIIGFSGNLVWMDNKMISESFSFVEIKAFLELIDEHRDLLDMYICTRDNDFYFYEIGSAEYTKRFSWFKREEVKDINTIAPITIGERNESTSDQETIARICIISKDETQTEKMIELLEETFKTKYSYVLTNPTQIEVTRKGMNKAERAITMIQDFSCDPKKIIVAGDSYNDLSMFEKFEESYCMASAPDVVQREAKHIIKTMSEIFESLD